MIRQANPELYGEYAMKLADFYHTPIDKQGNTRYDKLSLSHRMHIDTFLNQDAGVGRSSVYRLSPKACIIRRRVRRTMRRML